MIDLDRSFVSRQRSRGFSWQAIAAQIGVCEHDLRRLCETGFAPLYIATERPKPVKAGRKIKPRAREPRIGILDAGFAMLAKAGGDWVEIADLHHNWQSAMNIVSHLRGRYGKHIIERRPAGGAYRLTPAGLTIYNQRQQEAKEMWIDRRRERAA